MVICGQIMAIGQEGQFATETDVRRGRQDIRTFYVKVRLLQPGGIAKPGMTAEVTFRRPMQSNSAAIQARELTKRFGSFVAVDRVSFEVDGGELFGLLGPNGAGKTTLIRMLTTLIAPTSGQAWWPAYDVTHAANQVREAIGVIPQALTSDLELTGWQNLDVYGEFYGLSRRQRHQRAEYLLEMVGAYGARAGYGCDLFGRDAPAARNRARLDSFAPGPVSRRTHYRTRSPVAARGLGPARTVAPQTDVTISLTTHYMDEAEKLCDRIAIIDGGKIVAMGTTAELKAMIKGSDRIASKSPASRKPRSPHCVHNPTSRRSRTTAPCW